MTDCGLVPQSSVFINIILDFQLALGYNKQAI